jgi:hypothetical protein
VSAAKTLSIVQAPAVLIVTLQRFDEIGRKVVDHVDIGELLQMPQHLPLLDGSKYKLYGVVCHSGTTIHNGHYVSYVRTATGWRLCDDQTVTPVSVNTVYNCQAYILFYTQEVEVSVYAHRVLVNLLQKAHTLVSDYRAQILATPRKQSPLRPPRTPNVARARSPVRPITKYNKEMFLHDGRLHHFHKLVDNDTQMAYRCTERILCKGEQTMGVFENIYRSHLRECAQPHIQSDDHRTYMLS